MLIPIFCHRSKGLSLIETIVSVAVFMLVSLMLYTTYTRVFITARAAQARIDAVALANEQFEIARNLPYEQVGTILGIPPGVLRPVQTLTRAGMTFIATTTVRNIDQPFDGVAAGSPNDLSPADNKLVEINITCITCRNFRPMMLTTWVGPDNVESASTNGSLFVKVLDSYGLPIKGANINVVGNGGLVNITDLTATSGLLQIIDIPPGVEDYQIFVSKAGYSSEQTYERASPTDNPVKPKATVAVQSVTQLTFAIDHSSDVNFTSVSPSCAVVPNINLHMNGTKLISTSPNLLKYDNWMQTSGAGTLSLSGIEWDTYDIIATSSAYELAGVTPLLPVSITPGSTQNIQLVMVPKNSPSVLVTVKDSVTGLPVTNAEVTLEKSGASTTQITGRGFLSQTDWSGGSGQSSFTDESKYNSDDSGVDVTSIPGAVSLHDVLGLFAPNGTLYSSTFDTGSVSNFYQFLYQPSGQPVETGDSVHFQLATGNSTSSWTYLGPDGSSGTFYTATTTDISAVNNGNRYLRYKMMLSTASSSFTPNVSDVQFTFTSSCVPPGQVIFQGLANGTYNITVSKSGYVDTLDTVTVSAGTPWQEKQEDLSP